jgi:hypothetical protein
MRNLFCTEVRQRILETQNPSVQNFPACVCLHGIALLKGSYEIVGHAVRNTVPGNYARRLGVLRPMTSSPRTITNESPIHPLLYEQTIDLHVSPYRLLVL